MQLFLSVSPNYSLTSILTIYIFKISIFEYILLIFYLNLPSMTTPAPVRFGSSENVYEVKYS